MYTLSDIAMLVVNETNEQSDKEKTNYNVDLKPVNLTEY